MYETLRWLIDQRSTETQTTVWFSHSDIDTHEDY